MHRSKIDIAVLLVFFVREETLRKVFEQIKLARPSKLFLYQDGPRQECPDDTEGIRKCRAIVEEIDWECEVHKLYQKENRGSLTSGYLAHTWMLSKVEMGIILEDDVVPSQSFFPFCKQLLERYANDTRINYITGTNSLPGYDNGLDGDYFFSIGGSIWGWATWRRTINQWDENLSFLDNQEIVNALEKVMGKEYFGYRKRIWERYKKANHRNFESILGAALWLNSQLCITPKKNLISNIGIAPNSDHNPDALEKVPKHRRHVFFSETHELDFPLSHPKFIINDIEYFKRVQWQVFYGPIELRIKRRIKKLLGKPI